MKTRIILSNKYLNYSLILLFGLFLGWMLFHPKNKAEKVNHYQEVTKGTIWTCAMHPQIKMPQPGKCPICGMDLIPLSQTDTTTIDPDAIHLTPAAAQLANVLTSTVSKGIPVKDVRLYGKVEIDERLLQNQVAHIPGRIESLDVNFTGEQVFIGQTLGYIYSPDLITAQQELIEAAKLKESQYAIYEAAKEKLRLWKLTDTQISEIEASEKPQNSIGILSNTNGVIISRRVSRGDYVSQGTVLFEIADISKVWIMFDAYESDLQFIQSGETISFTIQALPGEKYSGKIVFIDPVIDPVTRITKVRVETENRRGRLKPGMFVTGNISSVLGGYINLIIPRSSVLWTGKRSIVYVKQGGPTDHIYKMREVELGPMLGDSYVVKQGLSEGEEIVTQGTFSVDAAAQLEGKSSMMNTEGGNTSYIDNHESKTESHIMNHATFKVSGNCEMCKERIENAARSVKGVINAVWDITTKTAHVDFNGSVTTLDAIQKVIADAGHDNDKYIAPDKVYNKLPECCLYRK